MKNVCKLTSFIGFALALASSPALSQAPAQPAVQPIVAHVDPVVLPVDQQATREQLFKMFEVMRTRETIQNSLKMAAEASKPQLVKTTDELIATTPIMNKMTQGEKDKYRQIMYKFSEDNMNILNIDQMMEDNIEVYQKYLTRKDVDMQIAFVSSEEGQHFLNQLPGILKESTERAMKNMGTKPIDRSNQLTKNIQELINTAQAEQLNNQSDSNSQAGSKRASFLDRLGMLVNALSSAYTPGQSFAKTLEKAAESSASQQ